MHKESKDGHVRFWRDTSAAEIKTWVATVIMWSAMKNVPIQQIYDENFTMSSFLKWFPSYSHWENIKRYFEVCHPVTEGANAADKLHKIRELFDYFVGDCR